jgi:hypothetical protein
MIVDMTGEVAGCAGHIELVGVQPVVATLAGYDEGSVRRSANLSYTRG